MKQQFYISNTLIKINEGSGNEFNNTNETLLKYLLLTMVNNLLYENYT